MLLHVVVVTRHCVSIVITTIVNYNAVLAIYIALIVKTHILPHQSVISYDAVL